MKNPQSIPDHAVTMPSSSPHISIDEFEELLIYFTSSIGYGSTEEELANDLVKNCTNKFSFAACTVYSFSQPGNSLTLKATHNTKRIKPVFQAETQFSSERTICETVARTGTSVLIPDSSLDARFAKNHGSPFSRITVPIINNGQTFGVIDCEHLQKNFFSQQHVRLFTAIASLYGIRISKLNSEQKENSEQQKIVATEKAMAKMRLQMLTTQLRPHFLFNSINAIQYLLLSDHKRQALSYLNLLGKLIRTFLMQLEKDRLSVKDETDMLEMYLQLQSLRYENRFSYHLDVIPSSLASDTSIPPFLTQSILENFLELLVAQSEGKSTIYIQYTLCKKDVIFRLVIEAHPGNYFNNRIPEYRQGLTQWEDYIDIYNRVKKYNIELEIKNVLKDNQYLTKKIIKLKMPIID